MNELMVKGWLYFETNKETAEEAYDELIEKLNSVGVNGDNMRELIVLRDEYGDDVDYYKI